MQANHLPFLLGWSIFVIGPFASGLALADDNDPASIEQRLKGLEATVERKALVREPAAQARKALKRVLEARAAGDAAHAVELAALANDWVDLAANVVRAVEIEKEVASEQSRLAEIEQKRRRTETLLEATIAQRERTREELKRSKVPQTSGPLVSDTKQSTPAKAIKPHAAANEVSTRRGAASKPPAAASVQAAPLAPRPQGSAQTVVPPQPSTPPRGK